jgi:hypothetical protein
MRRRFRTQETPKRGRPSGRTEPAGKRLWKGKGGRPDETENSTGRFGCGLGDDRHVRRRPCAADHAAHLHGRPAAAGRDAHHPRRVPEAPPEREGRDRGRRRHLGAAAAIPHHGARVARSHARHHAHRRDPAGAMGRGAMGRAARLVSRARQGEDHGALPPGLPGGEHGQRQGHGAAVLRGRAVPVLPQGPAREVRPAAAADLGRGEDGGAEDPGRREQPEPARIRDRRRSDRGHRVHLPGAALGRRRQPHRRDRQALARFHRRQEAVRALGRLEEGERHPRQHRRDRDRPHPPELRGRQRGVRDELGLYVGPRPERSGQPREGQGRRGAAAGLHPRQGRDLHRRLAARGVGVLEEQGRGREARAVSVEPRGLEDAGHHRLSHAGLPGGLYRSRRPQGQSLVRRGAQGRADGPRAARDAPLQRGLRDHQDQHERLPGRHEDPGGRPLGHAEPARHRAARRALASAGPALAPGTGRPERGRDPVPHRDKRE